MYTRIHVYVNEYNNPSFATMSQRCERRIVVFIRCYMRNRMHSPIIKTRICTYNTINGHVQQFAGSHNSEKSINALEDCYHHLIFIFGCRSAKQASGWLASHSTAMANQSVFMYVHICVGYLCIRNGLRAGEKICSGSDIMESLWYADTMTFWLKD
jgi:hypothetical protein